MAEGGPEPDKDTFNMATASKSLNSDSTSLVDLKAEVFRKRQEAVFNKSHGRTQANVTNEDNKKKNNIWSKSNVGILKRNNEAAEEARKERIRIQNALEQKAAVYNKLKGGQYQDPDSVFLVNFTKKTEDNNSDDDEISNIPEPETEDGDEWVEYIDALGRSRMCMKSELKDRKDQDKKELGEVGEVGTSISDAERSMLSEDMRREQLRRKWELEEEENLKKKDTHYGDVLFDEARTHGAGFYKFSRNESDRHTERENLDSIHKETVRARSKIENEKSEADAKMAIRLRKIKNKKRKRMGLPPLPPVDSDNTSTSAEKLTKNEEKKSVENSVMDGIKSLRNAVEKDARKNIVREWDIGKDGVAAKEATDQKDFMDRLKSSMERKVLTQSEWNDKKRQERPSEFAPKYDEPPTKKANNNKAKQSAGGKQYNSVPPPKFGGNNRTTQNTNDNSQKTRETRNIPQPPPPPLPVRQQHDFDPNEPLPPGFEPTSSTSASTSYNSTNFTKNSNVPNFPPPPMGFNPNIPPPNPQQPQFHPPAHGSARGSIRGSARGSFRGPARGSAHGSAHFSSKKHDNHEHLEPSLFEDNNERVVVSPPSKVSLQDRLQLHQETFNPKPIENEVSNDSSDGYVSSGPPSEEDENEERPKRAEIPPPTQAEYYNSYQRPKHNNRKGQRSHEQMAEAFLCGLKSNLVNKDHISSDDSE